MSWSRRNSTLCLSSSARISANERRRRARRRRGSTFESSAPIVQVSGSTLMEPRVAAMRAEVRFAVASGLVSGCPGSAVYARSVRSSDDENRRAGGLAGFEVAMRLRRILQLVALVDLDPDPAGGDVVEQLAAQAPLLRGIGDVIGERGARDDTRDPLIASCVASIGGTGPEAVPTHTSRPRFLSESIEPANVSLPTLS